MQQIKLPSEIKIPGVIWVVLITGVGIWAQYNLENPTLLQLIMAGVFIVLRTLVDNDATLKQASDSGTAILNYVFGQRERAKLPTVAESGVRGGMVEPIEPIPVVEMPKAPNAVVSWLLG
jgi:hypothetical protein